MSSQMALDIVVVVVLISFSAYFSATETAFTSANRIRMKNMAGDGNKKAERVLRLLSDYDDPGGQQYREYRCYGIRYRDLCRFIRCKGTDHRHAFRSGSRAALWRNHAEECRKGKGREFFYGICSAYHFSDDDFNTC